MNDDSDFTIDGTPLDPENKEFKYALDSVQYTNQLIYLTGKAGTGKTTFLKYLRKVTTKKMVVLAPTGVAAVNAKGQTIHSFFHIPLSLFVPEDRRLHENFYKIFHFSEEKIKIIQSLELLVIDEISMVRCDLLDVIDAILRKVRKQNNIPCGGVQVLLIGDTFQLPPVVTDEDWEILGRFYKSGFFFSAMVMTKIKPLYIELKKIYRQKEQEFVDILNRIRVGQQDPSDLELLNSRVDPYSYDIESDNYIILTTTNKAAKAENEEKMKALTTESFIFEASVTGDFLENDYPTDKKLEIKKGAQVMFLKNNPSKGYYNGKIGRVIKVNKDSIVVDITNEHNETISIKVEPFTWGKVNYRWDENEKIITEEITGTFTQFPLKLAWAITVHKSQGMTFEKVIADIGRTFAAGQTYVALSRCTTLNGLILRSKLSPRSIITDPRVIEFAKNEVPETLILEELQKGKADYYYAVSRKCIKAFDAIGCYENFVKAIKYRNDIETNNFKRFVYIWIKRFETIKNGFYNLKEEYKELMQTITEQKKEISKIIKEKEILEEDNSKLGQTIQNKENIINELTTKLIKYKEELFVKNDNLKTLNADKKNLESIVHSLEEQLKSLQDETNRLKSEIRAIKQEKESLTKEIDRVSKIKWYQKLFGKK
jgi:hypothetical protein